MKYRSLLGGVGSCEVDEAWMALPMTQFPVPSLGVSQQNKKPPVLQNLCQQEIPKHSNFEHFLFCKQGQFVMYINGNVILKNSPS